MRRKTDEEIRSLLPSHIEAITIPQDYSSCGICLCHRCNQHFHIKRHRLLSFNNCPVCAGKQVVKGYNDVNTTHPQFIQYFVHTEDGDTHSAGSEFKTDMKCPTCGYIKKMSIDNLIRSGFACNRCSDGLSYPNKLILNILSELPIQNLTSEYSPDWANRKRYDTYFEYNNKSYIVEMNGQQHYYDSQWTTAEYQQENDHYKTALARGHEINIIHIDCIVSSLEYIKQSIISSALSKLFDLSKVDWAKCHQQSIGSMMIKVCKYFSNNPNSTSRSISKLFHLSVPTVITYLKRGTECGLCDYSIIQARKRQRENLTPILRNRAAIPVNVYDTNGRFLGYYSNIPEAAEYLNTIYDFHIRHESVREAFRKHGDNIIYKHKLLFQRHNSMEVIQCQ